MFEKDWIVKKRSTRIVFYAVCLLLIGISVFGLLPQAEYLIGWAVLGLPIIFIYTDIRYLLTQNNIKAIVPFESHHQEDIDQLMLDIESEFEEKVTSPEHKKISELVHDRNQNYWVALAGDQVVGTVGVVQIGNKNAALKRMMVAKKFRGNKNAAKLLLETSIDYSRKAGINTLYLGTMSQMKAAQRFYAKNGFVSVTTTDLPKNFPSNPVDTLFYKLEL